MCSKQRVVEVEVIQFICWTSAMTLTHDSRLFHLNFWTQQISPLLFTWFFVIMLTLCDYVSFCRFSRGPRPPSKSWPKLAAIQQTFIRSHFESVCVLCDLVFFCVPISRVMPRRRWRIVEVPEGWIQMLRGPVPRSEPWPKVDRTVWAASRQQDPRGRSSRNQGERKEPPSARIHRNPVVLASWRPSFQFWTNDPIVVALKEALRQARLQTQVRFVEERIESTKLFIERARKRVSSCKGVGRVAGGRGEGSHGGRFSARGRKQVGIIAIGSPASSRMCISKFRSKEVCSAESWASEIERRSLRKEHMRKPHDKKSTPAKQQGIWREIYKFKAQDKATFHQSSDEMDTLRRSRNSTTVVTANGEVQTNEAQVFVTISICSSQCNYSKKR